MVRGSSKEPDRPRNRVVREAGSTGPGDIGKARPTTQDRILKALDSKDKIPAAYELGGSLYNFWQDDEHVQGIWRKTSLESYKGKDVSWETVLDIDALPPPTTGTAKTWVWHGSTLLDDGNFDRCMISLSPGGSDADTTREFCLKTNSFLEGGFEMLEPAKSRIDYRSRDECLVGTDFGKDGSCMTDSGYPVCRPSGDTGLQEDDASIESSRAPAAAGTRIVHGRVATPPPRLPRGHSVETGRPAARHPELAPRHAARRGDDGLRGRAVGHQRVAVRVPRPRRRARVPRAEPDVLHVQAREPCRNRVGHTATPRPRRGGSAETGCGDAAAKT